MIKYVIWDFNGTILDDKKLSLELLNQMLKKQNKPKITMTKYLKIFGFPIKDYYLKAGISFAQESFLSMAKWYIKVYQPKSLECSLNEGVEETLKALNEKGIKNICLSASKYENLKMQLDHFQITKYFDAILGLDNIIADGKLEVGLNYLKTHQIDPNACILIGDTNLDYEIAIKMGVMPVLYANGHQAKSRLLTKTEYVVDNIKDLLKIIKGKEKSL